jgi:hypothetical protein
VELRTYIFGGRAVTIAIRPRGKAGTPDLGCQDLDASDFAVTTEYRAHETKLVGLVRGLGLRFAAVDSLVSRGRVHFLEVNANGGWGWLPPDLQVPLDREIRRLVLAPQRTRAARSRPL